MCPFLAHHLNGGLSLCIQGTFAIGVTTDEIYRFIPVHTGNIKGGDIYEISTPVYPCAYREHWVFPNTNTWLRGLSLCIQGTSQQLISLSPSFRFIPVHTGNILYIKLRGLQLAVYPCAYREHNKSIFGK